MPDSPFCPDGVFPLENTLEGPLRGLRFGVKDVIDIAAHPTGAGNPDWLRTHPVPTRTAPCVERLLQAGAEFAGKTMTDEICASMSGINPHYGTPLNSAAPDRLPGGSSSGSAAAVSRRFVEFALGTDTSGSVRLPASYCGVYGYRPTHGRICCEGVMPLAPSFDAVGLLAGRAETLVRAACVLLGDPLDPGTQSGGTSHLLIAVDAFGFADAPVLEALVPLVKRLQHRFASTRTVTVYGDDVESCLRAHLVLVEDEFHRTHQAWIDAVEPTFGEDVGARMKVGAPPVDPAAVAGAEEARERLRTRLDGLLQPGTVLCIPTVHCIAPLKTAPLEELTTIEIRSIVLGCLASLAGLPQVTCPWATAQGAPVGLSFIGRRGGDERLLSLIERLAAD